MGAVAMTVRVLLCPPLFFAQRKKWVSFVINGLLYAFCLLSIGVGLNGVITGVEGRQAASLGIIFWLFSLAHVADARRRERAPARPPVSFWSRVLESVLIITVAGVMAVGFSLTNTRDASWGMEVSRVTEARWQAEWVVEQTQQYQRVEGHNAGSFAELRQRFPEADIEVRDPWGRDWVVSRAFQDARTPLYAGDLWVCSRGPAGTGHCPPENLGAVPSSAAGSIGYSARFGGWQGGDERAWLERLTDILAVVLILGPLPGYVAYRVIRRVRGSPAPPLRMVSGAIGLVVIVALMAFIAPAMSLSVAQRARAAKAEADIRAISAAIAEYRAHVGSSPATLADLTVAVTNSQGPPAGPFLEKLPTPPCCGRSEYTYKRSTDGRYLLKHSDPHGNSLTVVERGP